MFTITNGSYGSALDQVLFLSTTPHKASSHSLTFPFPCNFLGINRIKIKSSVFRTKNVDTISNGACNLLTTIGVNNATGGLIAYQNQMRLINYFENTNVDFVDITIG